MKKILFALLIFSIILSLSACGEDYSPAFAEVTTSSGQAYIFHSVNGVGYSISGAYRAQNFYTQYLHLKDGETATIHFYCDTCGHDETITISAPFAKLFSCDCLEETREYLSIVTKS